MPELNDKLRKEYTKLFDTCKIKTAKMNAVDDIIRKMVTNKAKYDTVSIELNIPWYFIAVIHNMESSLNFKTHLHNGDPLSARTTNVPKGRPVSGKPPFSWPESVMDALKMKKLDKWTDWSIAGILFKLEIYNGWGYRNNHPEVLSPYLWSFSNHYTKGKYVSDGKWDANAVSQQCGAATLLRRMQDQNIIAISDIVVSPVASNTKLTDNTYPGRVIKKGDKDETTVLLIQKQLNNKGCGPIDEDADFGPQTYRAVRLFQARFTDQFGNPLKIDGEVGTNTWEALFDADSVPQVQEAKSKLLEEVLKIASKEEGVREVPVGSNWGPKVKEYLNSVDINFPAFWCAAFVYWCFEKASEKLSKRNPVFKTGHVLTHWNNADSKVIAKNDAVNNPELIEPGSIFIISTGGGAGHTGIVESVHGGYITTIEGNTNEAGSRNGIGVFRRERKINDINKGYLIYR